MWVGKHNVCNRCVSPYLCIIVINLEPFFIIADIGLQQLTYELEPL